MADTAATSLCADAQWRLEVARPRRIFNKNAGAPAHKKRHAVNDAADAARMLKWRARPEDHSLTILAALAVRPALRP
jgi:hypothetical protein